jgi:hypothetical protein
MRGPGGEQPFRAVRFIGIRLLGPSGTSGDPGPGARSDGRAKASSRPLWHYGGLFHDGRPRRTGFMATGFPPIRRHDGGSAMVCSANPLYMN